MLWLLLYLLLLPYIVTVNVFPIDIPLAPYNVPVFCRNGQITEASQISGLRPVKCPTSSTSCGYFEFIDKTNTIGVFECIDGSVFMSEQDEEATNTMFKVNLNQLCTHHPKCHFVPIYNFNKAVLRFLFDTYQIKLNQFPKVLKFCCSLKHALLNKVIQSRNGSITTSSSSVSCGDGNCEEGAVGCLTHSKDGGAEMTDPSYDYLDIKPVEITWTEEYDSTPIRFSEPTSFSNTYCVYPHLNDELYRYCLMIYNEKMKDQCYYKNGHTICCCFVNPNEQTCRLPEKTTTTTTITPTTPFFLPTSTIATTTTIVSTIESRTSSTTTTVNPTVTIPHMNSTTNRRRYNSNGRKKVGARQRNRKNEWKELKAQKQKTQSSSFRVSTGITVYMLTIHLLFIFQN